MLNSVDMVMRTPHPNCLFVFFYYCFQLNFNVIIIVMMSHGALYYVFFLKISKFELFKVWFF